MSVRGIVYIALLVVGSVLHAHAAGFLTFPLRRKLGLEDPDPAVNRSLASFKEFGSIKREGDGVYFADLRIGNPQQMFSVIVDTGSATIAVPCEGCSCGNHHHFSIGASSTASVAAGHYSQCYSEGSCNSGKNVRDKMCIGEKCAPSEAVYHTFGCCSRYARAFQRQEADGIIGMSGSSGTLLADLRAHHMLKDDTFALCLGRRGGSVSIGGYSVDRTLEPMQWVPYRARGSFYAISLTKMYVNGQVLSGFGSAKAPIVDSGTTFTYVPSYVHHALAVRFDQICGNTGAKCGGRKNPPGTPSADRRDSVGCYFRPKDMPYNDFLLLFPSIEMQFGPNVRICLPASSYLFTSKPNIYCVGLLRERSNRVVIGAITMSEFNVVFDHQNRRIGWARALCDAAEEFDSVTRAACCGSCERARQSGFGNHHPTIEPTSLPIRTPLPTITPVSQDTMVITLVRGKQTEASALVVAAGQEVVIAYSTTICATEGQGWEFAKGSSVLIKGEGTVVRFGTACTHLPTVFVDEGASLHIVAKAHVHVKEGLVNRGLVVLEEGAAMKLASLEASPGSVVKLTAKSSISGIALNHAVTELVVEGGVLELDGGSVLSDLRLSAGARMKLNVNSAFKGNLNCSGVVDLPLGVSGVVEGQLMLGPSAVMHVLNPPSETFPDEAELVLFTAKQGVKNGLRGVQLDTYANCAHGKLVDAEIDNTPSLAVRLVARCVDMCKTAKFCPINGGLSSGDSSLVHYMDSLSPFTLYVVSCTAGFLSAVLVLACLLLPVKMCPCFCKKSHVYEPIGK